MIDNSLKAPKKICEYSNEGNLMILWELHIIKTINYIEIEKDNIYI